MTSDTKIGLFFASLGWVFFLGNQIGYRQGVDKAQKEEAVNIADGPGRIRMLVESMRKPGWPTERYYLKQAEQVLAEPGVMVFAGISKEEKDKIILGAWERFAASCSEWSRQKIKEGLGSEGKIDPYYFYRLEECIADNRKVGDTATANELKGGLQELGRRCYTIFAVNSIKDLAKNAGEIKKYGGNLPTEQIKEAQQLLDSLH